MTEHYQGIAFARTDAPQPREVLEASSRSAIAPQLVATLFDSVGEGGAESSLQGLLREGWSLSRAWNRLPESRRAAIRENLPENFVAEALALSGESDAELFYESFLQLAHRQRQNRPDLALRCFELIRRSLAEDFPGRPANHASLIARSQRETDAIEGRGAIGARFEYLSSNFMRDATSPIGLASMAVGGLAFSAVRTGALARLLSGPAGSLTRGFGARALASMAGFSVELPAFVLSGRALHEASGQAQDWSLRGLGRDFATAGITLGLLKLGGAGAGAAAQRWASGNSFSAQATRMLLPQASMLTGIYAAHRIEESLGMRPHVDGATVLTDTFTTFLQFHVTGRLLEASMGPGHAAWQREMNLRSEIMASTPRSGPSWIDGMFGGPRLAVATGVSGTRPRIERVDPLRDNIVMMANGNEGKPPEPPPNGPSRAPMASESGSPRRATQPRPAQMSSLARRLMLEKSAPPIIVEGTRLGGVEGRFEVIRELGRGNMGEVYLVRDTREVQGTRSERLAVIKVPSQNRGDEPEMNRRIIREIRITESLTSSPFAAPVYDFFEYPPGSGINVPVMAYIDGPTFQEILAARPGDNPNRGVSLDRRIDLFAQLCLGIQDAHNLGVSHNDLKPDNFRVDSHNRMRILDWGLARRFAEGVYASSQPPSPVNNALGSQSILSELNGTPGYTPPELTLHAMSPETMPLPENPRLRDIYSLGIILWESATTHHPFGEFRPGNGKGEPELVPVPSPGAPRLQLIKQDVLDRVVSEESFQPPTFRQVLTGEFPSYLNEIENIARRAMHRNPAERYQSASELREAVLMARANSDREALNRMNSERRRQEEELTRVWDWRIFNVASKANPNLWAEGERTIHRLNELRSAWREGVNDLTIRLYEATRYEHIPEAHRMIAELSWEKLEEGGDRLAHQEASSLEQRIRDNDFDLPSGRRFSEVLTGGAAIKLNFRTADPNIEVDPRVRIIPWQREVDSNGRHTGNFRPGETLVEGRYSEIGPQLQLPAGYYAFEIFKLGFAQVSVPVHVSRRSVRETVQFQRSQSIDVDLIPRDLIPTEMVPVQGGVSRSGWDFYHEGMPSNVYSFPMKAIEIPTFAIARNLVTVNEYRAFIEDLLSTGKIREALDYMPRKRAVAVRGALTPAEVSRIFKEERGAFYWSIDPVFGQETGFSYRLNNPLTKLDERGRPVEGAHLDPNGDPILPDQPISAITPLAARAYVEWRGQREGFHFRLATADEIEKVNRNSFPWTFPWGYESSPFSAILRMTFQGDRNQTAYPQPQGRHPMGQEYYRDHTIYGTRENLGNVREFTSSEGEPGTVVLSGGSVRVSHGPFLISASRNYAHLMEQVADSVGGIRLAMDLPPTISRPR